MHSSPNQADLSAAADVQGHAASAASAGAVSLVVSTYNWDAALTLCLGSIATQRCPPLEVIVADDGSRPDTVERVHEIARDFPVALRHLWQPDQGFRLAKIRNRAIAAARGDYLIMIDGDLVLHADFVGDHVAMARPGAFLQGNRALLDKSHTMHALQTGRLAAIRPWLPGLQQPSKTVRWPWLARRRARPSRPLGAIMGCNQSFWRSDLLRLNGFDEDMVGWGFEDTDLVARCLHAGLIRRNLKNCAIAAHLHHATRGSPDGDTPNKVRYQQTLAQRRVRCDHGVADYLAEFERAPLPDLRCAADGSGA